VRCLVALVARRRTTASSAGTVGHRASQNDRTPPSRITPIAARLGIPEEAINALPEADPKTLDKLAGAIAPAAHTLSWSCTVAQPCSRGCGGQSATLRIDGDPAWRALSGRSWPDPAPSATVRCGVAARWRWSGFLVGLRWRLPSPRVCSDSSCLSNGHDRGDGNRVVGCVRLATKRGGDFARLTSRSPRACARVRARCRASVSGCRETCLMEGAPAREACLPSPPSWLWCRCSAAASKQKRRDCLPR
jgi:hypothetical protein